MAKPSGVAGTRSVATDSCSPGVEQVLRPSQQVTEPVGFGDRDRLTERCHREIAPAFVVQLRVRAVPRLLDQPFLQEPPDTPIQVGRKNLSRPARITFQFLHQRVSVAFTAPEDHQDAERFGMKGQKSFGFGTRHRLRQFGD